MRTLGIDLSAKPTNTAACVVAWDVGRIRIERVELRVDDDRLTDVRAGVDVTAIDSPFGWPEAFVKAVGAWGAGEPWPGGDSADRSGGDAVFEVYPAAAGMAFKRPKKPALAGAVRDRCPWLDAGTAWETMETNDHALDALMCALVGRAIAIEAVGEIPRDDKPAAEREGWIHVPTGRLEDLV